MTWLLLTYDVARIPANKANERRKPPLRARLFLVRFMEALMVSRLQQAHREIVRHAHLLPRTFDEHGNRSTNVTRRRLVVSKRELSPAKPPRSSPPGAVLFQVLATADRWRNRVAQSV